MAEPPNKQFVIDLAKMAKVPSSRISKFNFSEILATLYFVVAISRATDYENQNRLDGTLSQDFSSQL
jgi:hypothetical protein